ncbi:MAG: hypothetical protein ACI8QZ_000337 [Chlamydiales bacterium]|jgi:hypothetical protein
MSDSLQDQSTLEMLTELPPEAVPLKDHPQPSPLEDLPKAAIAQTEGAAPEVQARELEQAPLLLRKASKILLAGALFPYFVALKATPLAEIPWGILIGAKAVALLAAFVFHEGFKATHGGKTDGPIAKLASAHKVAVPVVAGVLALLAFGVLSQATHESFLAPAAGEVLTLLLAAVTFTHIFAYEHGGKFNPVYPLMFLGPGLAGLLSVFGGAAMLGGDAAALVVLGLVGNLVVAAGGLMAIYTMYVAMKQAKIEGDLKKDAARTARKAQRTARRNS